MNPSRQHTIHRYRMSGLNVASEIVLPMHNALAADADGPVDVTVALGQVPTALAHTTIAGPNWMANDRELLLNLPEIGGFLAQDGQRLTIEPAPGVPVDDILVFATGTALAAILYQRGAMVLHGSAIARKGKAILFCGPSGAGKSTLAAALCRAGSGFLSDDFCSIEEGRGGAPMVQPDGRILRLYPDSIDRLDLSERVGPRVRQCVDKFHVTPPTATPEAGDGMPLAAIYLLTDSNPALAPGIIRLPALEAAQALLRQTYRRRMALAYCAQGRLAARTAALLSHAKVYLLSRPRDLSNLDRLVETVQSHWAETD